MERKTAVKKVKKLADAAEIEQAIADIQKRKGTDNNKRLAISTKD